MYEWRRRIIEVEIVLFHVLAVVALVGGQAEEAFLEDGIAFVPENGGEAKKLIAIANAGDTVLAPAIGFAAGEFVRQIAPGVAVGAVIFADGGPGALADVRPPATPAAVIVVDFLDSLDVRRWDDPRLLAPLFFIKRHKQGGRRFLTRLGEFCQAGSIGSAGAWRSGVGFAAAGWRSEREL